MGPRIVPRLNETGQQSVKAGLTLAGGRIELSADEWYGPTRPAARPARRPCGASLSLGAIGGWLASVTRMTGGSSAAKVMGSDLEEAEVVSPTQGDVLVVNDGEGLEVHVGRFCTLDHSPVPGTSDGEGPPSAMDIRTRTEGAL